jgi:hypothetical protein
VGQPSALHSPPAKPTRPAHWSGTFAPISPTRRDLTRTNPYPAREPAGPVANPSPSRTCNRPGQPPPTNDPAEPPHFPNPLRLTGFLPPRPGGRRFGGSPAVSPPKNPGEFSLDPTPLLGFYWFVRLAPARAPPANWGLVLGLARSVALESNSAVRDARR